MLNDREALRRAIPFVVGRAIRQRQNVDVTETAIQLSSRYWHSGMALDEICCEIEAALHMAERLDRLAAEDAPTAPPLPLRSLVDR